MNWALKILKTKTQTKFRLTVWVCCRYTQLGPLKSEPGSRFLSNKQRQDARLKLKCCSKQNQEKKVNTRLIWILYSYDSCEEGKMPAGSYVYGRKWAFGWPKTGSCGPWTVWCKYSKSWASLWLRDFSLRLTSEWWPSASQHGSSYFLNVPLTKAAQRILKKTCAKTS